MAMELILQKLVERAREKNATVGIGLGVNPETIQKINSAIAEIESARLARPIPMSSEKELISSLMNGKVDAIVRGGLGSHGFLRLLKATFNKSKLYRLALLETIQGHQFFYAPVGIDEGRTLDDKKEFIIRGCQLLKTLKIPPKVAILSGGRMDDRGRDPMVDESIENASNLLKVVKEFVDCDIQNYNILIEDAIKSKCNLILAPEGMSGNLIYRTLVHLGGGKSHGALYLGEDKVVIDTSRVAPENEYKSAMIFASGMK
ncbi:MAG: methanogenesis marker protein Mmp4/MtxX [Candidatus Helarchaeales archaeon]